jgi:hypothetical protein
MKKWKVFLGIALIFAAGFLSGITITRWVVRRRVEQLTTWNPDATRRVILARLTRELKLTPRQQAELDPILADMQADLLRLRSRFQPETHQIVVKRAREMAPFLTPDQQVGLALFFRQLGPGRHNGEDPAPPPAAGGEGT